MKISDTLRERLITAGCEALEPDTTHVTGWHEVVGDALDAFLRSEVGLVKVETLLAMVEQTAPQKDAFTPCGPPGGRCDD